MDLISGGSEISFPVGAKSDLPPYDAERLRNSRDPIVAQSAVICEIDGLCHAGNMPEGSYLYCDVSLPVPLDQPFTYGLPLTLRHRVRPGSRLVVPFGPRKLTGLILRCHDEPPSVAIREALRLLDSEPDRK